MEPQTAPTYLSLYSGVGGLDMGLALAGFTPVASCELDEKAHTTHRGWMAEAKKQLPHLKDSSPDHYDDAAELVADLKSGEADYAGTDVVIGGPPCQGFSAGGKLDPKDPRSAHVHTFFDVVDLVRPRYFVMENVAVLAKAPRWKQVRSSLLARAKKLGYATSLHVLDAADYGVAQHRERMILIGSRDGEPVSEPTVTHATEKVTVAEALKDLPEFGEVGNDTYYGCRVTLSKKPVIERARTPYQGIFFNGPGRPLDFARPSRALTASMDGGRGPVIDQEAQRIGGAAWFDTYFEHLKAGGAAWDSETVPESLRRITVEEAKALSSFPPQMSFTGKPIHQYRQIGNAVPPLLSVSVARTLWQDIYAVEPSLPETFMGLVIPASAD